MPKAHPDPGERRVRKSGVAVLVPIPRLLPPPSAQRDAAGSFQRIDANSLMSLVPWPICRFIYTWVENAPDLVLSLVCLLLPPFRLRTLGIVDSLPFSLMLSLSVGWHGAFLLSLKQ